jgi:cytochrome c
VDLPVYIGWQVFHAQCAACHAADARGSSFAPDLTLRMSRMTARDFFAALDQGYLGPGDPSEPRGRDPEIARYYNELWAYLSARASGELPPGSLERLPGGDLVAPDRR